MFDCGNFWRARIQVSDDYGTEKQPEDGQAREQHGRFQGAAPARKTLRYFHECLPFRSRGQFSAVEIADAMEVGKSKIARRTMFHFFRTLTEDCFEESWGGKNPIEDTVSKGRRASCKFKSEIVGAVFQGTRIVGTQRLAGR